MKRDTYHHGSLRPTLLAEAHALLAEGGVPAVTLREVARRAGVSATATYRHYRDKDALLAALSAEGFREFGARLAALAQAGQPFSELGRAYVVFALEHPGLFRLMFSGMLNRKHEHPELDELSGRAFSALHAASKSGGGAPAGGEGQGAAIRAWSIAHGLAHLMIDEVFPRAELERTLDSVFGPRAALPVAEPAPISTL